ncbi:MAG: hypothetical protein CL579_06425 [Alteromonadaceae bacterium]|nr:hypothetical protein [Alteromonadaceae bacterium]
MKICLVIRTLFVWRYPILSEVKLVFATGVSADAFIRTASQEKFYGKKLTYLDRTNLWGT